MEKECYDIQLVKKLNSTDKCKADKILTFHAASALEKNKSKTLNHLTAAKFSHHCTPAQLRPSVRHPQHTLTLTSTYIDSTISTHADFVVYTAIFKQEITFFPIFAEMKLTQINDQHVSEKQARFNS